LKKHDKGEFIFLHPRHRLNLPPIPKRNPYKGLQSFNEEDRELFYGRGRVIAELRAQCEANRLLVVSGVSGIGKSSVVKAGVLPVLREEGYRILPVLRPGINPVFALELVFKESGLFSPRASLRKLVLNDLIKKLATGKTVLLIDQYEELLTQCSNEGERQLFVTILRKLLEGTPPECFKIIVTVRADFETQFDQGELQAYWQAGRYTIPWFTVEELKEVIVMPSLQEVLIIDPPELVDDLINEVIQQPGALPLLSYTLSELYEVYIQSGRQDRALKKEGYDRLGGVMGALRTKADQLYHALDAAKQSTMRKIMLRMVSSEGELAGRRVMMDELVYADPAENQRVEAVIQKLVEARLVVKGKDYVEPAHDALVRAWKTLLEWIHAVGKDKIARQQRLKEQVEDYEQGKQDKNMLWDKDPRLELMKLELDNPEASWLNQKESSFIKKSLAERESKRKFKRRLIGGSISVLVMLLALIIVFVLRALVLKYYDGTFSDAKHFEEKAGIPIEDQSGRERQKSWLYTLAALGQDLDKNKTLPVSANRLIRQGVAAGIYQQIWSSSGTLSDINDIALSPDGKLLAIAGEDGSVRLGDMQTGVERHALSGHTHGVSAVAFSPEGKLLASASQDSTIRLWDVANETVLDTITGLKGKVRSIAFSPDGKFIAAGSQDRIIYIWNTVTGALADTLLTAGAVRSVTYSPDGRWLAAASADSSLCLWEIASYAFKYSLSGQSMVFSPDGKKLASASNDGTIHLRDAQTGAALQTFSGPRGEVKQLAFSLPDGHWLVAASEDSAMRIWDITTRSLKNTLHGNSGIRRIACSPDSSNWLISAGSDRSLRLWNITAGKELAAVAGHRDKINCVVFSETDRLFASGSDDGTIILWEAATGQPVRRFEGHRGAVLSLALREYASLLVSGGKDGTIRLWNLDNGAHKILAGHTAAVNSVALDLTDSYLASGSEDKTIRLWKISDGSSFRLGAYTSGIKSVAFSKKGALLAAGAYDGAICLWDLKGGKNQLVVRWYGHAKAVNALAFNLDGTRLASASDDDEIRLWDMSQNSGLFDFFKTNTASNLRFELLETKIFTLNERSLRDLRTELGAAEVYKKLADERIRDQAIRGEANFLDTLRTLIGPQDFAKYKSLILERASKSETEELTAYQINAEAAKKINFLDILRGHEDDVLSVSFSEDGRLLASGSRDETARLWEVNSGSELAVLSGHQDDVQAVAFNHESPNAILATAASDRCIRLWDVLESCNLDEPIFNKSTIREIAFSPNGQYLASVDEDKLLRLWKQNARRPDRFDSTFSVHGGWGVLLSVAFSPDNAWLAYGGKDDVIRLMDTATHQLISLAGNVGDGLSVAFHPHGLYLAAGSSDGKVRVWDLTTKKMITPAVNAHQDKVRYVAFSPDGQLLASAGSDKLVKLWRFSHGKLEYWKTFDNNQSGVWSADFSPDGNTLATA
jgi:WD40 repeat protein